MEVLKSLSVILSRRRLQRNQYLLALQRTKLVRRMLRKNLHHAVTEAEERDGIRICYIPVLGLTTL
jgi:hypothetical protein